MSIGLVIASFVYLFAVAGWLGGMVFFFIFATGAMFSKLGPAQAGRAVTVIFPRYYLFGYINGATALALAIVFYNVSTFSRNWWAVSVLLLTVALGLTFYAGRILWPKIQAVQTLIMQPSADRAQRAQFGSLQRLSVILNAAVFLFILLVFAASTLALLAH